MSPVFQGISNKGEKAKLPRKKNRKIEKHSVFFLSFILHNGNFGNHFAYS